LFLRTHQALAILSAFSIWRHLWPGTLFERLMIYIASASFLSLLAVQSLHILYQNKAMGAGLCQAYVASSGGAVKIRLHLSRDVEVKAGQYVGLWIPAAGFCSILQSHPYTVVSWSAGKQNRLDFLIEPRKGSTRKLFELSKTNKELRSEDDTNEYINTHGLKPHVAMISGPHGLSVPVGDYETVVMIASGFGIASQLPYLRQLIEGYRSCKTRNRRIRMVWVTETEGMTPTSVFTF
jgi:predicted ferric reductase